jgi:hypothetical protein
MDVERLLEDEDRGWQALHAAFARVPAERFEEPTLTPEGWSPKDAMFHVGGWTADCARVLEQIREGTFDRAVEDALDTEAVNRSWFETSRGLDPDDVHTMFEAGRQKMRECFATLPEITSEAWEWFEESGPLHYAKHVQDLEAWLG